MYGVALLYLRCVQLHLRLSTLYDSNTASSYVPSVLSLYDTIQNLLSQVIAPGCLDGDILSYCPYYISQMTTACGFTLLRLLQSSFVDFIDVEAGKALFNSTVGAIRKMSVVNNDIPGRLADVLLQLWSRGRSGQRHSSASGSTRAEQPNLQLRVYSRMGMSIMFDSLLQWRNSFQEEAAVSLTRTKAFHLAFF